METKKIQIGEAQARSLPGVGWEVIAPGSIYDFHRLMDLLMDVEVGGMPIEEAAQKYGAVVE